MLAYPSKSGSLYQQLEILKKQGIPIPTEINGQAIPPEEELESYESWILNTWRSIGSSRHSDDSGPLPITSQDILAYIELMDEDLRRIDIEMIRDIDKEFIDEITVQRERNKE